MRRAGFVALLAALVLLAPATQALAHGGNPNYRSVIEEVTPHVPGVEFQVLDYDSYMQLVDRGGHPVTIYGYEGEPYARILHDGTVQVNRRSPATYLNADRYSSTPVPAGVDPAAAPQWRPVSTRPALAWHDHRVHWMLPTLPPAVAADPGSPHRISSWTVVLTYAAGTGDQRLVATGTLDCTATNLYCTTP